MGQRCNLVIIDGGECHIYYDHWAANILDLEVFWGPSSLRKFIQSRGESGASLLDNCWSEGACVLDFDNRHLLWYGGEDVKYDAGYALVHAEMMAPQWSGWQVEWAKDGIFDVARKLGVSLETVTADHEIEYDSLSLPHAHESESYFFLYVDGLLSIAQDGKVSGIPISGRLSGLAEPSLALESLTRLVTDFSPEQFLADKLRDPSCCSVARWGAHFDVDQKFIKIWNSDPQEGWISKVAEHWQGWEVIHHGLSFRWHQTLLPDHNWPDMSNAVRRSILVGLRENVQKPRENPGLSALSAMKSEVMGKIEINSAIFEHREGVARSDTDKLIHLEALERALAVE